VVCTDKTGTLTTAEMTLQWVFESGRLHALSGVGYAPDGQVEDPARIAEVLRPGALCSDARLLPPSDQKAWRILGDTTEGTILVAAVKAGIDLATEAAHAERVGAFPFDQDSKLMTTVHRVGDGYQAFVKGSPEPCSLAAAVTLWDGREVPVGAEVHQKIEDADDFLAAQGLRVLAVARRPLASANLRQDEVEQELTFLGLVAMADPPRPEVTAAVEACHTAGIKIFMVTGDYGLTAEAIARRVGIVGEGPARIVSGADLDQMSEDGLVEALQGGD
jgi:Ca2+-transporting ATPase